MVLSFRPLTDAIGAEVVGLDLSKPMSADDRQALRSGWHKHLVLLVRGQLIDGNGHLDFARALGELDVDNPNTVFGDPKHPEIFVLTNEMKDGRPSETRDVGWQWHADLTYTTRPSAGAVLHAIAIPDHGGDTMFANMYLAYETLSPGYKRLLSGLEAVHDITNGAWFARRDPKKIETFLAKNAPVIQPMVSVHPETGRASLLIGETAVRQIFDMTPEESAPVLQYLTAHATQQKFVYRHRWQAGDLLVWDNRCCLHKVVADHGENAEPNSSGKIRRLHRVTLQGNASGRRIQDLPTAA